MILVLVFAAIALVVITLLVIAHRKPITDVDLVLSRIDSPAFITRKDAA